MKIEVHEEGIRRPGEIAPKHLHVWVASTHEEMVLQLKNLSLQLSFTSEEGGGLLGGGKKQVQKQLVELVSDEPG